MSARHQFRRGVEAMRDAAYGESFATLPPERGPLECALFYGRRLGWKVFPVRADKTPLIRDWPNKATDDREQIAAWWERWPDAGIGLATGQRSGIYVVDIDTKRGGMASWQEIGDRHGERCAQHVRSGLYARRRLDDFARTQRLDWLVPEAERVDDRRRRAELWDAAVRRLARLVALENPTLLPFLFPDGPGWPDDQTAMGADWDLWGVNGEPGQEREEGDPVPDRRHGPLSDEAGKRRSEPKRNPKPRVNTASAEGRR